MAAEELWRRVGEEVREVATHPYDLHLLCSGGLVRTHAATLCLLSPLVGRVVADLPPTVGAATLSLSLPGVGREAVARVLRLLREDWGEAVLSREQEVLHLLGASSLLHTTRGRWASEQVNVKKERMEKMEIELTPGGGLRGEEEGVRSEEVGVGGDGGGQDPYGLSLAQLESVAVKKEFMEVAMKSSVEEKEYIVEDKIENVNEKEIVKSKSEQSAGDKKNIKKKRESLIKLLFDDEDDKETDEMAPIGKEHSSQGNEILGKIIQDYLCDLCNQS